MQLEMCRPPNFNAAVLAQAFPADHEYRIALFEEHVTEIGTPALEKTLTGYQLVQDGDTTALKFESQVEWLNVTVTAMCAIVYDATTGIIMSITNFEKPVGVVNGLFEMTLNSAGVVRFGDSL